MSQGLLRSTALVSAWTLLSRLLGFLRDVLLAGWFGAGAGMDAFLVAFKIPNFLRRIFAEGAFSQAFVPVLAETRELQGDAGVRELTARVMGLLAFVLALLTLLAILASPLLVMLFAPGFDAAGERQALATDLLRLTFPYLLFVSLVALVSAVLQTYGRFSWPAFAPVLLNVCLITGGWWGVRSLDQPLFALAAAVFVAGLAQLILVAVPLWRMGLLRRPQLRFDDERVRRILRLMAPIIFASSVAQLALLIDSILASLLDIGSVSWLYFADRLMELPLGIFAIALSTVLLPSLSSAHAAQNPQDFGRALKWALSVGMLVVIPAAVALFVLALPLVSTLFQYQAFSESDAHMTARALRAYALGLLGFSFIKILAPAYFSRQDTRTPVRIGILALCLGMVFNLIAVGIVLQQEQTGMHWLLALGTSMAAGLNALLLWRHLPAAIREAARPAVAAPIILAALLMGGVLLCLRPELGYWSQQGLWARVQELSWLIGCGLLSYFGTLFVLGQRPEHYLPRRAD